MISDNPKVGVVICNWNKKDYVLNCIKSVLEQNYDNYDLYVVDNASSDGSVEAIRENFPQINLIVNRENLGGSGGFNTGLKRIMKEGKYKYSYLLDNDVILDSNALKELIAVVEKDSQIGMVGSAIYQMDYPDKLQTLGAFIDWQKAETKPHLVGVTEDLVPKGNFEVDYVIACSLLVRNECLNRVGLMDQEYFLYFDEIDWCTRIKKAGCTILAVPSSKVWHKMGSRFKNSNLPSYYYWRNKIFFLNRHTQDEQWEKTNYGILTSLYQAVFTSKYFGKKNVAKTLMTAFSDLLANKRGKKNDLPQSKPERPPNPFKEIEGRVCRVLLFGNVTVKMLNEAREMLEKCAEIKDYTVLLPQGSSGREGEFYSGINIVREWQQLDSIYDIVLYGSSQVFDDRGWKKWGRMVDRLNPKHFVLFDGYGNYLRLNLVTRVVTDLYAVLFTFMKFTVFPLWLRKLKAIKVRDEILANNGS